MGSHSVTEVIISHAFTPAYAGTHLSTPEGWKAEMT